MTENTSSERPECQGCASTSFVLDSDRSIVCAYCHTTFSPAEIACPECGASVPSSSRACPLCGADAVRPCQVCGALNPPTVLDCLVCGQELTILDALFDRVTGTTADRLRLQREQATATKASEKTASQARIAEMWAADRDRREFVARAQAKREQQERTFLTVTIAVVVFVVIAVVIAFVVLSRGADTPLALPRLASTFSRALRGWVSPPSTSIPG